MRGSRLLTGTGWRVILRSEPCQSGSEPCRGGVVHEMGAVDLVVVMLRVRVPGVSARRGLLAGRVVPEPRGGCIVDNKASVMVGSGGLSLLLFDSQLVRGLSNEWQSSLGSTTARGVRAVQQKEYCALDCCVPVLYRIQNDTARR